MAENMGRNPFITIGAGGMPMVTPIVQGGKFAPSIMNMASEYAKGAQNNVSSYLGQRGLTSSSFYPQMLEQAFRGGMQQAVGTYQGQQNLYNQWARDIINLRAQEEPEQERGGWQGGIGGAITGATLGASLAPKGSGWAGAGWGAAIGGGAGLLGLI